ncbi:MAG: bacterial transcriptional activator domain-containing protein, partial [Ktedonobacteraceae bacterium]
LTADDASWYQLADQSRLWLDADAGLLLLEQAEQAERTGEHPLALVEKAAQYLSSGPFLEGDDGLWLYGRRGTIEIARHRCLCWQARLYEQEGQLDKAQTLLLTLLEEDSTNEDILCQIMHLLHRRGMTSQALKLYKRTTERLAQDELEPTETTKALVKLLRNEVRPIVLQSNAVSVRHSFVPLAKGELVATTLFTQTLPLDEGSMDCATWFGVKHVQMMAVIHQHIGHVTSCNVLQAQLQGMIETVNEMKPHYNHDAYTLSRRQMLVSLAALPAAIMALHLHEQQSTLSSEEFLSRCAASLQACQHLMNGQDLPVVEQVLSTYAPQLEILAQQSSYFQMSAAALAAQTYRLKSILAWHRRQKQISNGYGEQAVSYARLSKNTDLLVANSMFYVTRDAQKTLEIYQEVLPYLQDVSSLLQSTASMAAAWAYAQSQQERESLQCWEKARETFPQYPEKDPGMPFAEGEARIYLWEALMYLGLSLSLQQNTYLQRAENTFTFLAVPPSTVSVPERIRIEAVNYLAEIAVKQKDLNRFADYFQQGVQGAKMLQSKKRYHEAISVWKEARKTWPNERGVLELADLFVLEASNSEEI